MSLVGNIGIGEEMYLSFLREKLSLDTDKTKCVLRKDETYGCVIDIYGQNVFLSTFQEKELPEFIKFGNIFDGNFVCSHSKLISMKGFPDSIVGNLDITYCKGIKSLDDVPKEIKGDFICIGLGFIEEDIRSHCKVGGNIYC